MRKLTLIILLFITSNSYSQWFQLPNLPVSGTVWDMEFVNATTGFITLITPVNILKTTDGGMTWSAQALSIRNIQFINSTTGFGQGPGGPIWKSTNAGDNWNILFNDGNSHTDIYFVNQDTGWACGSDGNIGKIWKTTNGGLNFTLQFTASTSSLTKLFFLKDKLNGEYVGWAGSSVYFCRTINSGTNWINLPANISGLNCVSSSDFAFSDTANGINLSGNKCISRTTNGGYNWFNFYQNNLFNTSKITMPDKKTAWISLGTDSIIKTSNFFQSYGKQKIPINGTYVLFALDTSIVYAMGTTLIKTTNGGGEIIVSVPEQSEIVNEYSLSQNYPNPFNPATIISFKLQVSSFITLKVYNVKGEEVSTLVNEKRNGGNYSVQFDAKDLPSGIYFYKLETPGFTQTRKMVLLK